MRVEIGVKDDNSISREEVDSYATGASGQQEYENLGIWFVELVHVFLAISIGGLSILVLVRSRSFNSFSNTKRLKLYPATDKKSSTMSRAILNCTE